MTTSIEHTTEIPETLDGFRLDQALAQLYPEYSRMRLKQWVKEHCVTVNGEHKRPKDKVTYGDQIVIQAELTETKLEPQAIELEIIFEDDDIIVLNKPRGLVVHPGAGNPDNTLLNALLHHDPNLSTLPRAGIIHRLDKDTTGLLVIAKTISTHTKLTQMMQAREINREYRALVIGNMIAGNTVDAAIGRHPSQRTKMAVISNGKPAVTHYRVLERFNGFTYLQVHLESGRTHQIRVHMAHIKHPVLGDPLYGGNQRIPTKQLEETQKQAIKQFHRQALHAYRLSFEHPISGEKLEFTTPLPTDFANLLSTFQVQ